MGSATAALTWWSLLVDVLAVARITRLLTHDLFPPILHLRQRLDARSMRKAQQTGRDESWGLIYTCSWCASVWVALVVVGAHLLAAGLGGPVGNVVFLALMAPWALSYGAGLLESATSRLEADG